MCIYIYIHIHIIYIYIYVLFSAAQCALQPLNTALRQFSTGAPLGALGLSDGGMMRF